MITDLRLETHHRDCFLLVRPATMTDRITAVMAMMEDEKGNVLLVQLYHQDEEVDGEELFTLQTVLALKEPYLKLKIP